MSRHSCSSLNLQLSSLSSPVALRTSTLFMSFHPPPSKTSTSALLLPPRDSSALFWHTFVVVCVVHTAFAAFATFRCLSLHAAAYDRLSLVLGALFTGLALAAHCETRLQMGRARVTGFFCSSVMMCPIVTMSIGRHDVRS